MKKTVAVLFLITSTVAFAQAKRVDEIVCFAEEVSAQNAMKNINRRHEHLAMAMKRFNRTLPRPDIQLVHDTKDSFGRTNCLIVIGKLTEHDHKLLANEQKVEDQRALESKRAQLKEKDPWGGQPLDLSGRPKVYRSCKIEEAKKESDFDCLDLIVTAIKGQEDVIEYRFWLGSRNGEGMAVYKSPGSSLELSKVMAQIKKDKEHFKWSFAPKDEAGAFLMENAEIEAK